MPKKSYVRAKTLSVEDQVTQKIITLCEDIHKGESNPLTLDDFFSYAKTLINNTKKSDDPDFEKTHEQLSLLLACTDTSTEIGTQIKNILEKELHDFLNANDKYKKVNLLAPALRIFLETLSTTKKMHAQQNSPSSSPISFFKSPWFSSISRDSHHTKNSSELIKDNHRTSPASVLAFFSPTFDKKNNIKISKVVPR